MPDGQVLEFAGLTKRFGTISAVADLTCSIEPGRITAFLGPNGAGKTTTLRMLLGLIRPTSGIATIGGRRYDELTHPLHTVGAVLEATGFHPGRTGAAHLTVYAQTARIPRSRVDEVLELVGLTQAAGRKVGGYSLGMRQRLGVAFALLGDPGVLVLDEPTNGLDPEGIRWMRSFLRTLAGEGRTILVSSHLLAEVQQTVDAALIISGGRLVFEGSLADLAYQEVPVTLVDAPDRTALIAALEDSAVPLEQLRTGIQVQGLDAARVGAIAASAGVALSALTDRGPALEEIFLEYVNGTRPPRLLTDDPQPALPTVDADPITDAATGPADAGPAPDEAEPEARADDEEGANR